MNEITKRKIKIGTRDLTYIAMLAAVIAVCSWISVPSTVPFTMQTFGVFCALSLLGGRRGTFAVLAYILLGIIGAPVFSGFAGGVGVIAGPTGGYILGFLVGALFYWLITFLAKNKPWSIIVGLIGCVILCYAFGTIWFCVVYGKLHGAINVGVALMWCVVPFIVPDAVKILLALLVRKTLIRHVAEPTKMIRDNNEQK